MKPPIRRHEGFKNAAIPLDEALAIARQVANALEAAHHKRKYRDQQVDLADACLVDLATNCEQKIRPFVSRPFDSPAVVLR